jgi:hypothetical protein
MAKILSEDVKQSSIKSYFIRMRASHPNEFRTDLQKILGEMKITKEVIDPKYQTTIEKNIDLRCYGKSK